MEVGGALLRKPSLKVWRQVFEANECVSCSKKKSSLSAKATYEDDVEKILNFFQFFPKKKKDCQWFLVPITSLRKNFPCFCLFLLEAREILEFLHPVIFNFFDFFPK